MEAGLETLDDLVEKARQIEAALRNMKDKRKLAEVATVDGPKTLRWLPLDDPGKRVVEEAADEVVAHVAHVDVAPANPKGTCTPTTHATFVASRDTYKPNAARD